MTPADEEAIQILGRLHSDKEVNVTGRRWLFHAALHILAEYGALPGFFREAVRREREKRKEKLLRWEEELHRELDRLDNIGS